MRVDLEATDPAFADPRHRAENLDELLEWARARLGLDGERPWKLISARTKLKKILFEVEEASPGGPRRLIGKVSHSVRARGAHDILKRLWEAGFRPPSPHTVVQPIAWLPERDLLIQEKAPGRQLLEVLRGRAGDPEPHVAKAAQWLAALQASGVDAPQNGHDSTHVDKAAAELAGKLPESSERIAAIANRAGEILGVPVARLVPSHGDYHPMNVFIAPERVTVIDCETLGCREPMTDVSYFLAQTAIMGHLDLGSFAATARARRCFLSAYASSFPVDTSRAGAQIASAFIGSLHYEHCILQTGNMSFIDPWLQAAEACLEGRIELE